MAANNGSRERDRYVLPNTAPDSASAAFDKGSATTFNTFRNLRKNAKRRRKVKR